MATETISSAVFDSSASETRRLPEMSKVPAATVLEDAPDTSITELGRLSGLQQVAFWLAVGVGVAAMVVIVGLGIYWLERSPRPPALPNDVSQMNPQVISSTMQLIGAYKSTSEVAMDAPTKLFDQIIVKVFLPLFTLIVGYLFGERVGRSESGGKSENG